MKLLITFLLLLSTVSGADDEISNVIKGLSPHLSVKKAKDYAIIIDEYSTEYNINWQIVVAIICQESDFIHGEISDDYQDFGISQFNWRTVRSKQLDLGLLLTDANYAIRETVRHLAFLKSKYYTGAKEHWAYYTRWHSYTSKRRKIYWYGTIEHKYKNGLRYKLRMIARILENVRREPKLTRQNSIRGRSNLNEFGSTGRKESLQKRLHAIRKSQ